MPDTYRQILTRYWGYTAFRPLQEDIIRSVAGGNDTLALMPTGGGKSITFQVPALAKDGICLVVTPLIALMKDQVENLQKREIKAMAVYSGMSLDEIDIALDNCIYGNFKFLYVSPERLGSELFRAKLQHMNVNLLAVDESHCISQWGYDFRPSYLKIADIRKLIPDVPVLALTATATPDVIDDIQEKLLFKKKNVFKKSFERKNLVYVVRQSEDKMNFLLDIIRKVPGSGIVYVRNRQKTKELAIFLRKNGVSSAFYHAGLDNKIRNSVQNDWKQGTVRIIVATNAFGMGIDKADVRLVVHFDLPDTIEAYFQEAGRAGRDEKKAFAALLTNNADVQQALQRIDSGFPEIAYIRKVYAALGNFFQLAFGAGKGIAFDFSLAKFCAAYKFNILEAFNSLKVLEREGYIELTDELNNPSRVHFIVGRDDLYKFQVANAAFDGFIKLILRTYSGLFSDFVAIDEANLAQKANVDRDVIYRYLTKLATSKIIKYIPQKKTALIIYTEERLDEKNLLISAENYRGRRQSFEQKLHKMIEYASEQTKCRSQYLLCYFGDNDAERCGLCDVCQRRNEIDLSRYEFDLILEKIKKQLSVAPLWPEDLVNSLSLPREKSLRVIQWLLDNNKIIYTPEKKINWHA